MSNTQSKIVILQDYIKARGLLKRKDVEEFLSMQRAGLSLLDGEALDLLSRKRRLKRIESCKAKSVVFESNLTQLSDLLEDKIAAEEKDKEIEQKFLKQCEQLISRNERIKKNIADAFATHRNEALNPLVTVGLIGGAGVTSAAWAKLFSDKQDMILHAAEAGEAMAIALAFHRHARKIGEFTKEAISESPRRIRALKKSVRNSTVATALTIWVAAKPISEIEPRCPIQSRNARTVIAAKM